VVAEIAAARLAIAPPLTWWPVALGLPGFVSAAANALLPRRAPVPRRWRRPFTMVSRSATCHRCAHSLDDADEAPALARLR
jgi:hypothetical protein